MGSAMDNGTSSSKINWSHWKRKVSFIYLWKWKQGCWKALFAKIFSFYILLIPKESFQFQELPEKEFLFKISKYIFQTNSDEKKIGKEYCFTKSQTLSPEWKRTFTESWELSEDLDLGGQRSKVESSYASTFLNRPYYKKLNVGILMVKRKVYLHWFKEVSNWQNETICHKIKHILNISWLYFSLRI